MIFGDGQLVDAPLDAQHTRYKAFLERFRRMAKNKVFFNVVRVTYYLPPLLSVTRTSYH